MPGPVEIWPRMKCGMNASDQEEAVCLYTRIRRMSQRAGAGEKLATRDQVWNESAE